MAKDRETYVAVVGFYDVETATEYKQDEVVGITNKEHLDRLLKENYMMKHPLIVKKEGK